MNLSDYEAVWKRQPLPRGAEADLVDLKKTFEAQRRKMAAAFLVRDCVELGACGIVVIAYGKYWHQVGPAGWPMAIAILMVLRVAFVFARERLRTRRNRLGEDAPLLAKIEADLAELRHQRQLILRVWAWYIAPCAAAILTHMFVIMRHVRPGGAMQGPVVILVGVACVALMCWCVWMINRRAVRLRIEPRIAELEKLRHDLFAPVEPPSP